MKQIESVRLTGFQSHVGNNVRFSEGLNVIVGDTDTGKSAILRAISYAMFNKPWHKEFINEDSDSCTVELRFAIEGHTNIITRSRNYNEEINDYYIDGEPLENFGRIIPKEVIEITGLDKEDIDLVYASQHDPHFLIGKGYSGTERARRLVAFSDVLVIDKGIKLGTKKGKDIEQNIVLSESNKTLIEEELSTLDNVDQLQNLYDEAIKTIQRKTTAQDYLSANFLCSEKASELTCLVVRLQKFTSVYKVAKRINKSVTVLHILRGCIDIIEDVKKETFDFQRQIALLDLTIGKTRELWNRIDFLRVYCELLCNITNYIGHIDVQNRLIKQYTKEFNAEIKKQGICPLCNRKI